MRASASKFTFPIDLPCTVMCGRDGALKLSGTATWIESARLFLRLKGSADGPPRPGDEVQLKVHLPVETGIAAKDLSARARIIEASDGGRGVRTLVVTFRRAQFKDREPAPARVKRKAAGVEWEM